MTARSGAGAAAPALASDSTSTGLFPGEMERRLINAGFATVFWAGRPAEGQEGSPQGYLLAQRS